MDGVLWRYGRGSYSELGEQLYLLAVELQDADIQRPLLLFYLLLSLVSFDDHTPVEGYTSSSL
jgi:hypothetical protein